MTQTFEAVYEDGVLKPLGQLQLKERDHVLVTIGPIPVPQKTVVEEGDPLEGLRADLGPPDLSENFDDYRFGRSAP